MIIKILHLILGVRFFIFMGVMCRTTIRNNREVQPLDIHYPIGNILQKEVKTIVLITKQEMEYLTKVKKVPFGENGVSHTYGHHRTYYLCENRNNMRFLNEYRNSRIIKK